MSNKNLKKNQTDLKQSDEKSLAKQEDEKDHNGDISKVPWSAVQAYLLKYIGIGRFKEKYLQAKKADYKGTMKDMKGPLTTSGGSILKETIRSFYNKPSVCESQRNQQEMASSPKIQPTKRKGGSFNPIHDSSDDEDDYDSNSDSGSDYEELEDYDRDTKEDYAPRLHNLLTQHKHPNDTEFDLSNRVGAEKVNYNNYEFALAEKAKHLLVNPNGEALVETRYQQMVEAQANASQPVEDEQPGHVIFDNSLAFFFENESQSSTLDLQKYDSFIMKACQQARYFAAFVDTAVISLERNMNYDELFSNYFASSFSSHLASFLTSSNADFVVYKLMHSKSNIDLVKYFLKCCYEQCNQKRLNIQRQISLQDLTGTILGYDDAKLSAVLEGQQALEKIINEFQFLLKHQETHIKHASGVVDRLRASGISHDLTSIRKHAQQRIESDVLDQKLGRGMAQVMSPDPTPEELDMLKVITSAKEIGNMDFQLKQCKLLLLQEIRNFKLLAEGATYVNTNILDDLESAITYSTFSGPMGAFKGQQDSIAMNDTSGLDVWLTELKDMESGNIDFSLEKKLYLCQGIVIAAIFAEEKASQILFSIARRIGIDPLAPLIITPELSKILKEYGYYVEENVGISQAIDQLRVKMNKTRKMDADLEKIIQEGSQTDYVNRILDQIIQNFRAPFSATQLSEHDQETLVTYSCPSCNKIYGDKLESLPLTLSCGCVQCLTCSIGLKKCYIDATPISNIPDSPGLYNPTIHPPINFAAGCKINSANMYNFYTQILASNPINSTFKANLPEAIAFLSQLLGELYMGRHTKSMSNADKFNLFFNKIIRCSNANDVLKLVILMVRPNCFEPVIQLCEQALQIVDLYQDAKTIKYICLNCVSALVSASQLPQQNLLCDIILTRSQESFNAYCSAENINMIQNVYKSRKSFFTATHAFNYNDVFPLALNLLAATLTTLSSQEFDEILPNPIRTLLINEFTVLQAQAQQAGESSNFSELADLLKETFRLYYNYLMVYLRPISTMSDCARNMVQHLLHEYSNNLLQNVDKLYPAIRDVPVDDTLIDLKYSEVMLNKVKTDMNKIFDFSITSARTARAKEDEQNACRQVGSEVELLRSKLTLPGIQIDIPTDSSALKGLPPYFTAVSSYTGGNNPALPYIQFMMSEDAVLDNPLEKTVPPEMELAHTEGRIFYSGYDGFLDEYTLQTFDPTIRDSAGQIQPPDRILETKQILADSVAIAPPSVNMGNLHIPWLNLFDQLNYEKMKADAIKTENKDFYTSLTQNLINNPLTRALSHYIAGPMGPATIEAASSVVPHGYDFLNSFVEYGRHDPYGAAVGGLGALGLGFYTIPFLMNRREQPRFGHGIDHPMVADKKKMLHEHVMKKAYGKMDQLRKAQVLKPIMKTLATIKMRKNLHDMHDRNVTNHSVKQEGAGIIEHAPYCGHCGSRVNLRATTQNPEVMCESCYKGKGITPNRKIITERNSEDLATTSHPALKNLSHAYNHFVSYQNKQKPGIASSKFAPANPHWEQIKASAQPHYKQHVDKIIENFGKHKITEKFNGDLRHYPHHLKNTSILAGKMHSMLQVEKDNMAPRMYSNLKHNYLWHIHHLRDGKSHGNLPHNVIGAGIGFDQIAQQIHNNTQDVKKLASAIV